MWIRKVSYRVYHGSAMARIDSQMYLVYIIPAYFFIIHFNIVLLSSYHVYRPEYGGSLFLVNVK
jgi:hypothetical protein